MKNAEESVALYWDFDNIHISVAQYVSGRKTYQRRTSDLVDIQAIMDYVASLGVVGINRAYADWSNFKSYRRSLHNSAIDTIQRFNVGAGGKNGADIRLALDVLDDIRQFQHVTTVVVVSGDSDFISLAQRCRQAGRRFVGIGVEESCSEFFVQACDEFKFYRTLIHRDGTSRQLAEELEDFDEVKPLIVKAYAQLTDANSLDSQNIGTLKAMVLRLNPSFDEKRYGVQNFTGFLQLFPETEVLLEGLGEPGVTTVTLSHPDASEESSASPGASQGTDELEDLANSYLETLRAEKIHLGRSDNDKFWHGVVLLYEELRDSKGSRTTSELSNSLKERSAASGLVLSGRLRSRIILGSLYRTGVALHPDESADQPTISVTTLPELVDRVLETCWAVLEAEGETPDVDAAQYALLGPDLDALPQVVVDRWGLLLDERASDE